MYTVFKENKSGSTEILSFTTYGQAQRWAESNSDCIVTIAPTELVRHKLPHNDVILGHEIDGEILTYDISCPLSKEFLMARKYNNETGYGEPFPILYKKHKSGIKVMYGGEWLCAGARKRISI